MLQGKKCYYKMPCSIYSTGHTSENNKQNENNSSHENKILIGILCKFIPQKNVCILLLFTIYD